MKNPKSKIQNPKKHQGFTLVEVLTAVFLGSVIIIAGYSVYLISYKAYQKHASSAEVTQNARIALERMSRDIRQATSLITDLPDDPGAGPGSTEIQFQDGHTPNQIQYLTYYLQSTDLHRKVSHYAFAASDPPADWVTPFTQNGSGGYPDEYIDQDQVKAEKISTLEFWGEDVITIRLVASDTQSTYTFETKILGRNIQ